MNDVVGWRGWRCRQTEVLLNICRDNDKKFHQMNCESLSILSPKALQRRELLAVGQLLSYGSQCDSQSKYVLREDGAPDGVRQLLDGALNP